MKIAIFRAEQQGGFFIRPLEIGTGRGYIIRTEPYK